MGNIRPILIRNINIQGRTIGAYGDAISEFIHNNPKVDYQVIRIYSDQTYKRYRVGLYDLIDEVEYNVQWRFGCALLVEGECIFTGYLRIEEIRHIHNRIKEIYNG